MADQVAYWNGASGERWVKEQEALDRMLAPFGHAVMEAARAQPGESVIDVGCGCGETSLELSRRVGAGGRVLGVDLSAPMLDRAKARASGLKNLRLVLGDAAELAAGEGPFDLVLSRFGVMFFPDPARAFARLRASVRTPGRLAFVCWRQLLDNPWALVPLRAAASVLGSPEAHAPGEPGPFSFADPARVRAILEGAGFGDVRLAPLDTTMALADGGDPKETARAAARLGPVARLLVERSEADVAATVEAIERALSASAGADGRVELAAGAWVVTAKAG